MLEILEPEVAVTTVSYLSDAWTTYDIKVQYNPFGKMVSEVHN